MTQTSKEPLEKFKEIFGVGTVTGPYGPYQANKKASYQYNISGSEAKKVILLMLPYLFAKGDQAMKALLNHQETLSDRIAA